MQVDQQVMVEVMEGGRTVPEVVGRRERQDDPEV